jgi:hypothetical protein
MDTLISDSARVEISNRVLGILRAYCVQPGNLSPTTNIKTSSNINWYMNWRNAPPKVWLLCLTWIADVMNHTAEKSLGDMPPLDVLTGKTVDISILLCFFILGRCICRTK